MQLVVVLALLACCLCTCQAEDWRVELRMPQVNHTKRDVRICTSLALPQTDAFIGKKYISRILLSCSNNFCLVGFEHVGPPGVVHHLFAYGCDEPAGTTWYIKILTSE